MPTDRATRWSVTVNLKTVSRVTAEECIARARQAGWTVIGQLEQGESGTEHFQLAVATPQVRFSAVKKMFPTAHIEVAKDWNALMAYCQKEDTRKEELKTIEMYPTWKLVRDKFFEWLVGHSLGQVGNEVERFELWDRFIGASIQEGLEVDMIGVNPQYRSAINRYWDSYIRRQTDRQTEQNVVVPVYHNQDGVEEEEDSGSSSDEESGSWASDASPF